MTKAIKWFVIVCCISWAAHNPAAVSSDVHALLGAGQSLVSSVANAAGGAVAGVGNAVGGH
jgi:hypothetical protein